MGDYGIAGSFWHNQKSYDRHPAARKFWLVDSTKFDQTAFSVAGKLRDVDVVVTDRKTI